MEERLTENMNVIQYRSTVFESVQISIDNSYISAPIQKKCYNTHAHPFYRATITERLHNAGVTYTLNIPRCCNHLSAKWVNVFDV